MNSWRHIAFVFVVVCVTGIEAQDDAKCVLEDYEASCVLDVMAEHVQASAAINHCHVPVDITFRVIYRYGNDSEQRWQYTFVTSNQNERVLIPGLVLPPAPDALVYLFVRIPQTYFDLRNQSVVAVEASFVAIVSEDEWEEVQFLDEVISIDSREDCTSSSRLSETVLWILVGSCTGLLLVTLAISGLVALYRKKKSLENLALVASLEAGLPGAQPYQIMGAGATKKTKRSCENNNNPEAAKASNADSVKNYLTSGFSFGRLKEEAEKHDEEDDCAKTSRAVIIGNPTLVSKSPVVTSSPGTVMSNPVALNRPDVEEENPKPQNSQILEENPKSLK